MADITDHEVAEIDQANGSGRTPVVFAHKTIGEIAEIPGRGHSLTIDHGWAEVADTALRFVQRFVS